MKLGDMFVHWNQVRADLLTTIDKFGDEELSFVPFEGSWPVGKIMLHIAETEDGWLHTLVQRQLDPGVDYELADYPTKSAIKSVLDRARSRTVPLLDRLIERDLDTGVHVAQRIAYLALDHLARARTRNPPPWRVITCAGAAWP